MISGTPPPHGKTDLKETRGPKEATCNDYLPLHFRVIYTKVCV